MSKECHELKKADKNAFRATYGPKNAMRNCKKGEEPAADETSVGEFKNAAEECRADREADQEAFEETYGTNGNKKNAFGKCVSEKVEGRLRRRIHLVAIDRSSHETAAARTGARRPLLVLVDSRR